jgi:hypothetical protein
MTTLSQIRRLALIAAVGCVVALGWVVPAGARPIDDPALPNARQAQSAVTTAPAVGRGSRPENLGNPNVAGAPSSLRANSSSPAQESDWTLPIVLTGGVVLIVLVGSAGYARRNRTSHRAIA